MKLLLGLISTIALAYALKEWALYALNKKREAFFLKHSETLIKHKEALKEINDRLAKLRNSNK